jgi:hypothetical protein
VDNAFIEACNGTVRRECLSQHWFTGLEDAQRTLDTGREDYNNTRPHRSSVNRSPARYRGGGYYVPDQNRLGNSLAWWIGFWGTCTLCEKWRHGRIRIQSSGQRRGGAGASTGVTSG